MSADRRARDEAAGGADVPTDDATAPPDVDSLMSRLDGAPVSDRGSDPGKPSAAALLGRGARRRRGSTLRVPDDATPPPPPTRTTGPRAPVDVGPQSSPQSHPSQPPPHPQAPPPQLATPPASAPTSLVPDEPVGTLPSSRATLPEGTSSDKMPVAQQAYSSEVRIMPTRMISVGATSSERIAVAPPISESGGPSGYGSVPSLVAAAAASVQLPASQRPPPSSRQSTPPPKPASFPPTSSRLQTPYPMQSPFAPPTSALIVEPTVEPVALRPAPIPAPPDFLEPAPTTTPTGPRPPRPVSIPPPPPEMTHTKTPTLGNLDAQVKEALDLLAREDFETTAIDIAVEDEPTAPRLPAVQLPMAPAAIADAPPSEETDDVELEEVVPPTTAKAKGGVHVAPPPRKSTSKQPASTEAAVRAAPSMVELTPISAQLPATAREVPVVITGAPTTPAAITSAAATPAVSPVPPPVTIATVAAATTPSAIAPPVSGELTSEGRKKKKQWYEELFNDDFQRTMPKQPAVFLDREVGFIEDSLGCMKGATILDLGCGPGEHAVRLAKRGYEVIGVDLSLAMLARAADEAVALDQRINFVQGDMRDITFEEAFDGVYCWGTTFGYFDEQKNIEVIQKVHRALRRGGRLLLDVVNRDYVIGRQPSMAWFEGEGCVCMDEMTVNAITSRLQVKRTLMMEDGRQREIDYSIRLYALHELGKMLHDCGFRVAEASGDTSTPGTYFGAESPRILILAEKR